MVKKYFYEMNNFYQIIEVEDKKIVSMECSCNKKDCKHLSAPKKYLYFRGILTD